MKKIIIVLVATSYLFILLAKEDALSWDDKVTHKDLSKYASENSVLSKGYLSNIGLSKGLDNEILEWTGNSTIKKGSIRDWLQEGAHLEDAGSKRQAVFNDARYNNHFHNPLKPWESAGLTDLVPFTTKSAAVWAQDGSYQSSFPEGDWSWKKIRDYYRLALTSTTDTERQANFAQTFVGLGHQMHLVQDMAVPEHTRDDLHTGLGTYGSRFFEIWASENADVINGYAANPVFPTVSLDAACDGLAPVPVCNLFDSKKYYTSKTPSVSLAQGLAEYTNANFFSEVSI